MILCTVKNREGAVKACYSGNEINETYVGIYESGDFAEVVCETDFITVSFDESQKESVLYVPSRKFTYRFPCGEKLLAYDRCSWERDTHRIFIREEDNSTAYSERNLALNSLDTVENKNTFPHAKATFVTRNEPIFEARNAIDGVIENSLHGEYPYHSWSAGAKTDMEFTLDFGASVRLSRLVFYLRADFPHDTYWSSLDAVPDDGTAVKIRFRKTAAGQELIFKEPVITRTVRLCGFTQPEEPPSFATLTQLEAFGQYQYFFHYIFDN